MKRFISVFIALIMLAYVAAPASFAAAASSIKTFDAKDHVAAQYLISKRVSENSNGNIFTVNYSYDAKGRLVKTVQNADEYTYSYDKNDNLLKETLKSSSGRTYVKSYKYDKKGNLIESTNEDSGELKEKRSYKYDKNGYKIEEKWETFGQTGFTSQSVYTRDGNGNLTKSVTNRSDLGKFVYTYKYDNKGNLSKKTDERSNNGSTFVVTDLYSYDKNGNMTKWKQKASSGTETSTYSYDKKGNLTEIKGRYSNQSYSYDKKGNLKSNISKKSYFTSAVTYSYDSNNNLTKETMRNTQSGSSYIAGTYTYTYKKTANKVSVINMPFGRFSIPYASCTYNGKARRPKVTVTEPGMGSYMNFATDYDIVYLNNTKPGKGKIKIIPTFEQLKPFIVTFDIKPEKATHLKSTAKAKKSVSLAWDKVIGAKKYIVYNYAGGKYVKLATVTANKATIKNLKPGTTYKLCVKAVANGNVKGAYSAKLSVKTKS